jgi:phosphohistidine phosphatase
MILYIVRHAWAGQHGDPAWPDDSLRPLTKAGKKRFRRAVKRLVKRGCKAPAIATSPLVRCRETAELLAEALDDVSVIDVEALKPGATLSDVLAATQEHLGADFVLCGHAPDVNDLVAGLIGAGPEAFDMDKGAMAAISFQGPPTAGNGTLLWLVTAEMLGV